jgi:hypothetical protein
MLAYRILWLYTWHGLIFLYFLWKHWFITKYLKINIKSGVYNVYRKNIIQIYGKVYLQDIRAKS